MKIISWNVNGLQARAEDFFNYLSDSSPDIFALQETRLSCPLENLEGLGYNVVWYNATCKLGYSGTAVFYKGKPLFVKLGIGQTKFDVEARLITLEYPDCFFLNVYVPNSQSDPARKLYRINWDTSFRTYVNGLQRRGKSVIIAGDFNVAHQHIDTYPDNTRNIEGSSDFLTEERDGFDELLDLGLADAFRQTHPKRKNAYTWWSGKFDKCENNGKRLDYFLISESLTPSIISCDIRTDIESSDHAPIELELNMSAAYNDEVLEKMWNKINWKKTIENVEMKQKEISTMAYQHKTYTRKEVAKSQKNLVKSIEARTLAVRRVADRAAAPGIDGVMWTTGAEKMRAALSMSTHTYIAQPSRFVIIKDKKNKKERHIHVPTLGDRAMQMLYSFALDPVSEATADKKSFAFRKGRSAFDLHAYLMKILNSDNSPKFVVKADVEMYYASISHKWLLKNIPISPYILGQFIKNGHVLGGHLFPPKDTGISLGTSISPIIANMTLDGAQKKIHDKLHGKNNDIDYDDGALFRFADDILITARTRETAEKCLRVLEDFITARGLRFSPNKTQIIDLDSEGFDLLSWHFEYVNNCIFSTPSKSAVDRLLSEIHDIISDNKGGQKMLITKINQKLQGWASYHKITDTQKTFRLIDTAVNAMILKLYEKRYGLTWKRIAQRYFFKLGDGEYVFAMKNKPDVRVIRLTDIAPINHKPVSLNKNPYIDKDYYESITDEREIQNAVGKYKAVWTRQNGICYYCGLKILKDEIKCLVTMNPEQPAFVSNRAYVHDYCERGTAEFYNHDEDIKCRLDFYELLPKTAERTRRIKKRHIFQNLMEYFAAQNKKTVVLSFKDIEKITGKTLCRSAYVHKNYWYQKDNAMISTCWRKNGYRLKTLDIQNHKVTFELCEEKRVIANIPAVLSENPIPATANAELAEFCDYLITKYGLA